MRDDSLSLQMTGSVLLAVATLFGVRELALGPGELAVGFSLVAGAVSLGAERFGVRIVGPLGLGACVALSLVAYWAGSRDALGGLGVCFAAFVALGLAHREASEGVHRVLIFQGIAWAGIALSMAMSHLVFHVMGDETVFVERRVWLTVAWTLSGLTFFVRGSAATDGAVRNAGFALLGMALVKLLLYDTTHLDGPFRIAVFGLCGLAMLGSGLYLAAADAGARRSPRS